MGRSSDCSSPGKWLRRRLNLNSESRTLQPGRCQNSTGLGGGRLLGAVYNLAIPNANLNSVSRAPDINSGLRFMVLSCLLTLCLVPAARAVDWSAPEQQLARKIVAITGNNPISLAFVNRSSLGRRDREIIQNGVRSALEGLGARFVKSEPAAVTITISLSENQDSYIWVAEIHRNGGEPTIVMASVARPAGAIAGHDSVPLSLRKTRLWTQADPILDVAVLEENAGASRIAVLSPENIALYRLQGPKWQVEQTVSIAHVKPWPRDLRGRLVQADDHAIEVYLPGIACRGSSAPSLTLQCRDSEDPWPLIPPRWNGAISPNAASGEAPKAFFATARNFFTGALTAPIGKLGAVPKFYSAAFLVRENSALWVFTGTDTRVHIIDGTNDQVARLVWGSDLASVRTSCGSGWQLLATSSDASNGDSVRAYEFPDRDPFEVSSAEDFSGSISALWTEAKGDTAVAVTKDRSTGSYEAFRLAMACGQ